ncbi:unnamed protein product [Blepharisma stoltei]|uniref:ATP synthase F0 subunit 8 n=1 Tax=Blepharisma stoltei TaxID=1481888 RepID=A0AAU9JDA7_9CILI|nr:unnamed protein product [Blepharisma stoltei]
MGMQTLGFYCILNRELLIAGLWIFAFLLIETILLFGFIKLPRHIKADLKLRLKHHWRCRELLWAPFFFHNNG